MISYAQNFEDVMLERLFSGHCRGFYVDVGAWDPHRCSVTKHFYLKGWRSINIEPIGSRIRQFEVDRPRDVNLCVAISREQGYVTFWECREEDALSTTEKQVAEGLRARGFCLNETRVRAGHLDEIFSEYKLTDIDFLKIDVEGAEADVIRTSEFKSYRPRVLVIEATKPSLRPDWSRPASVGAWGAWEGYILEREYVFAYFDGLNRFYVRAEDNPLGDRLQLPPGLFDNIENLDIGASDRSELVAKLEALETDRATRLDTSLRLDAEVHQLRDALTFSEADRAARLDVIHRLDEQIHQLRDELAIAEAERIQTSASMAILEIIKRELGWANSAPEEIQLRLQNHNSIRGAIKHLGKRIVAMRE